MRSKRRRSKRRRKWRRRRRSRRRGSSRRCLTHPHAARVHHECGGTALRCTGSRWSASAELNAPRMAGGMGLGARAGWWRSGSRWKGTFWCEEGAERGSSTGPAGPAVRGCRSRILLRLRLYCIAPPSHPPPAPGRSACQCLRRSLSSSSHPSSRKPCRPGLQRRQGSDLGLQGKGVEGGRRPVKGSVDGLSMAQGES